MGSGALTLVGSGALTWVVSGYSSSSKVMGEPLPWWVVDTHPAVRLWRSLTLVGSGALTLVGSGALTLVGSGALTLVGSRHSSNSKVMEEPLPWWVVEP